jgi:hypothetical protein
MLAFWSDHVDRTLEAVEDVRFAFESELERFVVLISAMFTPGHGFSVPFLHSVLAGSHFVRTES